MIKFPSRWWLDLYLVFCSFSESEQEKEQKWLSGITSLLEKFSISVKKSKEKGQEAFSYNNTSTLLY